MTEEESKEYHLKQFNRLKKLSENGMWEPLNIPNPPKIFIQDEERGTVKWYDDKEDMTKDEQILRLTKERLNLSKENEFLREKIACLEAKIKGMKNGQTE